jgi:hypothetical protein
VSPVPPTQDQSPFDNLSGEPPPPVTGRLSPAVGHTSGDESSPQYEALSLSATRDILQLVGNAATSQSAISQLNGSQLPTSQPATPHPATSQPATSQPATPQPATSQPAMPQPATLQPTMSQPATSQLATSQPATFQPVTVTSQLATSQPATSQPVTVTSQLATSQLATSQFAKSQLGMSQLATSQLGTSQLGTSQLGTSQPATKSPWAPTPLNEFEACVSPDEYSIIEDCLLKRTPYIVNNKYMTLICTDCGRCINPEKALEHLRKHHSHCKVGADFSLQLSIKFPDLVMEVTHPLQVVEPVFGLAIPLDMYTVCTRCYRGYINIPTWRHHACRRKDVNLDGQPEHFPSHVQTFFRGPKICYFPVKFPISVLDEAPGDDFHLFKSAFQPLPISEDIIDEPEDYRELSQFLAKEGWIKHVSGNSRSELFLLTTPPSGEEILKPTIAHDVTAVMFNIQAAIGKAGYHVRRLLGKRPS